MNTILRSKEFIIVAFLLSLLFHASVIIYIIWHIHSHNALSTKKKEMFAQKNIIDNEWIEIKAGKGIHNTPILFQDEPHDNANEPNNSLNDTSDYHTTLTPINHETPDTQSIKETITISNNSNTESSTKTIIPNKKKATSTKKIHATSIHHHQENQHNFILPKPSLSLAQLTQGFLNHVQHENKHSIHMIGKKTGIASDEQIKYERYLQKINWCLQNSLLNNQHRIPGSATRDDCVHLTLMLNQNGTIKNCITVKSSGNRLFDRFILYIINDASQSFPPVPHYLPHDPFIISFGLSLVLLLNR